MFLNTKTIKAIAVLSFAKKSIASCGCSIEALTGQTIACSVPSIGGASLSVPDFATEGSSFSFSPFGPANPWVFDSATSAGQGTPAYTDTDSIMTQYFEMSADSSIGDNECSYNLETKLFGIGCWACPTPRPTVYPTSSPSDSPIGNDEENNEDDNEEESEDEEDNEDDEENDDGCCCCCEEKEVKSSLLYTIKNVLVVGN